MRKVVVVDIDGTVANSEHRLHFIKGEKKAWDAFHDAAGDDEPIDEVIQLVRALSLAGYEIAFVTARVERTRKQTEKWVFNNVLPYYFHKVYMRADGDFRPDYQIKEEILFRELGGPENVLLVLDDRTQVVEMWRRHGIRTLQVAEGNY